MLGKNKGQVDIFNQMIYEKLIPKNHLLLKIDNVMDFSFIYDIVKDYYSDLGRESYDPVMLFKLCLLEYLYVLSDRQVVERAQTDIVFRWFLGLNIDDKVPDYTTISYFRSNRLGDEPFERFFNAIVQKCIDKDIVKVRRYIIDSTDVAANVNYPSDKKLLCNAYRRVIRELEKINSNISSQKLRDFQADISLACEKSEKVNMQTYCAIAKKHAEDIYVKCYSELSENKIFYDRFLILWNLIEQYTEGKNTDKIVSCIDPDARVAHKSRGNQKKGYKDHIIVDEDSEIILASDQTPFNVGDEKKLVDLVEKVQDNFQLRPKEVSADKVYSTINNRAYLKDTDIITNIAFYDNSDKEFAKFDVSKFNIDEKLESAICPNGCYTDDIKLNKNGQELIIKFKKEDCCNCPFRNQCFTESDINKGIKRRRLTVSCRHDAVIRDSKRNVTEEFNIALDKRYKVERRFATLVRNHGLRRCRYLRLKGAKIHITLANTACNIVRMVNSIYSSHPSFAIPKIS